MWVNRSIVPRLPRRPAVTVCYSEVRPCNTRVSPDLRLGLARYAEEMFSSRGSSSWRCSICRSLAVEPLLQRALRFRCVAQLLHVVTPSLMLCPARSFRNERFVRIPWPNFEAAVTRAGGCARTLKNDISYEFFFCFSFCEKAKPPFVSLYHGIRHFSLRRTAMVLFPKVCTSIGADSKSNESF